MTAPHRLFTCLVWVVAFFGGQGGVRASNSHLENPTKTIVVFSQNECCPERAWPAMEQILHDEIHTTDLNSIRAQDSGAPIISQLARGDWLKSGRTILGGIRIYWEVDRAEVVLEYSFENSGRIRISGKDHDPYRAALKANEALIAVLIQQKLVPAEFGRRALPSPEPKSAPPLKDPNIHKGILGARAGVLYSTSEIGPKGLVAISAGWMPTHYLSFELEAMTTFAGRDIKVEETSSIFHLAAVRLFAHWRWLERRQFELSAGVGVGLAVPWVKGLKSESSKKSSGAALAAFPGVRLLAGWRLTENISLVLDAIAGTTLPSVLVSIGATEIAATSLIILEGSLALRWHY